MGEYVLRQRDREEIERLGTQHRLWSETTQALLARAGFAPGDTVADLGAGPGYLAYDLADRVGSAGRVLAFDSSEGCIAALRERLGAEPRPQIEPRVADLRELELEPESIDGATARWVLMYIGEIEEIVRTVARALRPGGRFAAMEYVRFGTVSLWPRGEHFRRLFAAIPELIARHGGDVDTGGRVPDLLAAAGLEIESIDTVARSGGPGTPVWEWMDDHKQTHQVLVDAGLITAEELAAYLAEWEQAAQRPGAFLLAPPVLTVIARKPA